MEGGHGTIVLIIAGAGAIFSLLGMFFLSTLAGAAAFVMFFIEKGSITDILGIKEVDALVKLSPKTAQVIICCSSVPLPWLRFPLSDSL